MKRNILQTFLSLVGISFEEEQGMKTVVFLYSSDLYLSEYPCKWKYHRYNKHHGLINVVVACNKTDVKKINNSINNKGI